MWAIREGGRGGGMGRDFVELRSRRDEDRTGTGVGEQGENLIGEKIGIDGDVDSADGEAGEVGDGPLPAIFREDGDAIALTDAPGAECGGDSADALVDLRGREGLPGASGVLNQHGPLAATVRDGEENVVERLEVKHARTNVSERGRGRK